MGLVPVDIRSQSSYTIKLFKSNKYVELRERSDKPCGLYKMLIKSLKFAEGATHRFS